MRWIGAIAVVGLLVCPGLAQAQQTDTYGWEDGTGTILGFYGNLANPTNLVPPSPPGAHGGTRVLRVTESPVVDGHTPQAYVAFIENLAHGDQVTASFWGYDDTPDPITYPRLRIWGHYATTGDINSYAGSASGPSTYSTGIGWEELSHTWTFDDGGETRDALVIEIRLYSSNGVGVPDTDYYVDDVSVTAPVTATITLPEGGFFPPPVSYEKLYTTAVDTNVNVALCAHATADGASIASFTVLGTDLPSNGTLWDGGTQITSGNTPYTKAGSAVTLSYHPNAGWSGVDTFWFEATDDQATPQTSNAVMVEIGVQQNKVVITEVMHAPDGDARVYEFVEIYNYTGAAVELTRIDASTSTTKDTTANLGSIMIPANTARIIAADATGAPDLTTTTPNADFRCQWQMADGDTDGSIIRVPIDNFETMFASPDATCYESEGSRILLYGAGGVLLDALDLGIAGATSGDCRASGGDSTTYSIDSGLLWPSPVTSIINDDDFNWSCTNTNVTDPSFAGLNGDVGNPMFIPSYSPAYPGNYAYADCYGACCIADGSCEQTLEADCAPLINCGYHWENGVECDEPSLDCPSHIPALTEAKCCLPTGACEMLLECECLIFGGTWEDGYDCEDPPACQPDPNLLIINELDYDQPSTDDAEFIELYATAGASLAGWTLDFFNGNASTNGDNWYSTRTIDLSTGPATMPDDGAGYGYLVVGDDTVPNWDIPLPAGIENGGCGANGCGDGIILAYNGYVVEAISYDTGTNGLVARGGPFDGTLMVDIGLTDDPSHALQKIPDGSGPWMLTLNNTPGEANFDVGDMGACCYGETCAVEFPDDCATGGGVYLGDLTDCDPNPCIPRGACCRPDGTCQEYLSDDECLLVGGTWLGEDITCVGDIADFVECMAGPDTTPAPMAPLTTQDCLDGFDYDDDGDVDLADFMSYQQLVCVGDPIGACCPPDGVCVEINEFECVNLLGGEYRGDGVICAGLDPECEAPEPGLILINEIWANDESGDTNEFIELYSPTLTGASLAAYSLIIVDGDTEGDVESNNYRRVNFRADLAGYSLDAQGYFVMGFGPELVGDIDEDIDAKAEWGNTNGVADEIQNGSQTYALVQTTDIATITTNGMDYLTEASVTAINANSIDVVATADQDFDHFYFYAPLVRLADGSAFGYAQRIPNGTDTNAVADWEAHGPNDVGEMDGPADPSTPGAVNSSQTLIPGACCDSGCSVVIESACAGDFLGVGTSCTPDPCTCYTIAEAEAEAIGTAVTLCDVVVSSTTDLIGSTNSKSFQMQDATGGITVYGVNADIDALLAEFGEGDQVDLAGTTGEFNGLFQLAATFSIVSVDGSVGVPAATTTVAADYQDGSGTAEVLESMLVSLANVTFQESGNFAYGNYTVSPDGGTTLVSVRVSTSDLDLIGQAIPTGAVTLTGIFSQYDSSSPYDGGYQLLLRSMADIN